MHEGEGWARHQNWILQSIARDDMPTGWVNETFSDGLGRDSRAFKSSAYITICVRDSTGSKQGVGMGQTETNAKLRALMDASLEGMA